MHYTSLLGKQSIMQGMYVMWHFLITRLNAGSVNFSGTSYLSQLMQKHNSFNICEFITGLFSILAFHVNASKPVLYVRLTLQLIME